MIEKLPSDIQVAIRRNRLRGFPTRTSGDRCVVCRHISGSLVMAAIADNKRTIAKHARNGLHKLQSYRTFWMAAINGVKDTGFFYEVISTSVIASTRWRRPNLLPTWCTVEQVLQGVVYSEVQNCCYFRANGKHKLRIWWPVDVELIKLDKSSLTTEDKSSVYW